ncbi:MAG: hypothetical protein ACI4SB_06835 [Acutalibacteraceae bacterium]
MKKTKKLLSLLLALTLVVSSCVIFTSAQSGDSDYTPSYDIETPVVLIHGFGQNTTYALNSDGSRKTNLSGDYVTGWPLTLDVFALIKNVLPSLIKAIITRKDSGLSAAMEKGACEALSVLEKDSEGNYVTPFEVPCLEYPFSEMTEEEKESCYEHIPIQEIGQIADESRVYYFGYDTFGDVTATAEKLHNYIHDVVLAQTGADKVSLCPISLGGTIAVEYLDKYPEDYKLIKKIVYVVPAIDGSDIVGDLLTDNLSIYTDDDTLYNRLMVSFMGDSFTAYLVNLALRLLPSSVLKDAVRGLAKGAAETLVQPCTQMWALCPTEYYEQARSIWLEDEEFAAVAAKVDSYMQARANFESNQNKLIASGAQVYDIVCYGNELYPLSKDYRTTNADGLIDAESTSMGATFAPLGTTFSETYVQAGTYCSDPTHNHISPDRTVDPTTGLLPDTTWYFNGQKHESLAGDDVCIKLAVQLLCDDNMKNVYSNPDAYPQFNGYRQSIRADMYIEEWQEADKSELSAEQIAEVEAAVSRVEELKAQTVIDTEAWLEAESNLKAVLIKAGVIENDEPSCFESVLTKITKTLNQGVNAFYSYIGK